MGAFHTSCKIDNVVDRAKTVNLGKLLVDEIVFAEKGNLLLLGARTRKGLNLRVGPRQKKLVAAGSLPAAHSAVR